MKNESKEVLIMGNGFDLACKLKTSYEDFFYDKYYLKMIYQKYSKDHKISQKQAVETVKGSFIKLFNDALTNKLRLDDFTEFNSKSNGWARNLFKQQFVQLFKDYDIKDMQPQTPTNWDVIFISAMILMDNRLPKKWCDIEKIIFEVITTVLTNDNSAFSKEYFSEDESRSYFIKLVNYVFKESRKSLATSMLDNLQQFEVSFGNYIQEQIKYYGKAYIENAAKLLCKITGSSDKNHVMLDVINFNYSLDENIIDLLLKEGSLPNIKINSWTNIHGIAFWNDKKRKKFITETHGESLTNKLSAPIFGIDGHDILSSEGNELNLDDPRIIFTKSFRLIDNNVNVMRDKTHNFQEKVDKIIFYGHSLGRADYSYFESLFDMYEIYNGNTELNFYYHTSEKKLDNRVSERKVLKKIVNLLTSYGKTLSDQHGENIVNKLVLEQQLNLLPSPNITVD